MSSIDFQLVKQTKRYAQKSSPCIVTYLLHFNFSSIEVKNSPVGVHVIFLAEKKRIGVSMFAQITLKPL